MTDQLVARLQEQLTEAHTRLGQYVNQAEELQKLADSARALRSELAGVEMRRNSALAAKADAERAAAEATRKPQAAERDAAGAREELAKERKILAAVRKEARQFSELNARISRARHVGDLFADTGARSTCEARVDA
jgi:chromosome segregation ATPase